MPAIVVAFWSTLY